MDSKLSWFGFLTNAYTFVSHFSNHTGKLKANTEFKFYNMQKAET